MKKVNICEAKTQLSKLVEEAASGHDVVIVRAGLPVARLTRLQEAVRKRRMHARRAEPVRAVRPADQ